MRNDTRQAFNRMRADIAHLSGVTDASETFAVEPSVQQRLESRIQESSEFLQRINMIGVDEIKGEKLLLGVSGPVAGRTDVSQNDREPRDLTALDNDMYEAFVTEFDTYLNWSKLDAWAKFRDFQVRVRNAITRQQALDRIMIGFNGRTAATQTDRIANPMLQDVNVGWLQQYRNNAPARVLDEGATAGKITVGAGGDYNNLDAVVVDAVNEMVDPWHQESTDLVVVMGRQLLADKYFPLINSDQPPTEQRALDMLVSQKRVGGLGAVRVPHVPAGTMLITSTENLSIYWQEGSRRRRIVDEPRRRRVATYDSVNEAYVIEDYGFGCLVENIEFV